MSIQDNKKVVTDFWTAFSTSDFDSALGMLAEDATWTVQGKTALSGTYNKAEFTGLLSQVTPRAPGGIKVTPKQLTAEDNRVSVEAESYAEITNGRVYENIYHFMFELRDGQITAVREYLDTEHVTEILVAE